MGETVISALGKEAKQSREFFRHNIDTLLHSTSSVLIQCLLANNALPLMEIDHTYMYNMPIPCKMHVVQTLLFSTTCTCMQHAPFM